MDVGAIWIMSETLEVDESGIVTFGFICEDLCFRFHRDPWTLYVAITLNVPRLIYPRSIGVKCGEECRRHDVLWFDIY